MAGKGLGVNLQQSSEHQILYTLNGAAIFPPMPSLHMEFGIHDNVCVRTRLGSLSRFQNEMLEGGSKVLAGREAHTSVDQEGVRVHVPPPPPPPKKI